MKVRKVHRRPQNHKEDKGRTRSTLGEPLRRDVPEALLKRLVVPAKERGDRTDSLVSIVYDYYRLYLRSVYNSSSSGQYFVEALSKIGEEGISEQNTAVKESILLRLLFEVASPGGTFHPDGVHPFDHTTSRPNNFMEFLRSKLSEKKDSGEPIDFVDYSDYGLNGVNLTIKYGEEFFKVSIYYDEGYSHERAMIVYTDFRVRVEKVNEEPTQETKKTEPAKPAAPIADTETEEVNREYLEVLDRIEGVIQEHYPKLEGKGRGEYRIKDHTNLILALQELRSAKPEAAARVASDISHRLSTISFDVDNDTGRKFPKIELFLSIIDQFRKPIHSFDVRSAVQEALEIVNRKVPETISIEVDVPEDLSIKNRIGPFKAIISEAVANSIDSINSTDNSQGRIKIGAKIEKVRYGFEEVDTLVITISDNGDGVTPGSKELFKPSVTTKESGSGTGLALCLNYTSSLLHRRDTPWKHIMFIKPPEGYSAALQFHAVVENKV